jgi:hypothetical protein
MFLCTVGSIGIGLLLFGGVQIVKSATRSIMLPLVATIAGAVLSHSLPAGQTVLTYGANFYQYLMIVGIVGLGMSALMID